MVCDVTSEVCVTHTLYCPCRRFDLNDVPTDSEEDAKQWLIQLYQEKVLCGLQ